MKFSITNQQLELDLSLSKSSLEILVSDGDSVELEFSGLRKKTVDELFKVSFRNNRLLVKEKSARNAPLLDSILNTGFTSDLLLKIPARTQVTGKIATLRGNVTATEEINFSGLLKTITGNIELAKLVSDGLDLNNISGNTRIGRFEGDLRGKTMTGRFSVADGVFRDIYLKGLSGDISLDGLFALESEGEISTLSGNIQLNLKGYKGESILALSTLSGNCVVVGDYPEECIEIRKRMPMMKNHPFKTVFPSVKEFCSSFFTAAAEDEVEVQTDSAAESSDDGNIKRILQMLSEGKLSAEEAEKLIRALGKKSH